MADWEQRELCPDGACTGVIGPDGTCKVCGRAAPGWGSERQRGMKADDDEEVVKQVEKAKTLAEPTGPDDFEERQLCRDGGCIGVIGDDGRCRVCGLAGEPPELG